MILNQRIIASRNQGNFLEIRINFTIWLVTTLIKFSYYAIMIYWQFGYDLLTIQLLHFTFSYHMNAICLHHC